MADVTVKVLTPATSTALITLDELKLAYGIDPADTTHDAQLQMLIDQYSDVVATMCNRTFAKETVEETWRGDPPPYENTRVYLTHYPVADGDVTSVGGSGGTLIDSANYEIENESGKLTLIGTTADPIIVTYSGGYDLPDAAPPALKAAIQLLVQQARTQLLRGFNPNLRMVQHGDTRVMYYDPSATKMSIGGDAVANLLSAYIRYPV
jgi:hypothetical protein